MSEYIRPDRFTLLRFKEPTTGEMMEFAVNPKYDRIDYFEKLGAYIIKIYDDEIGLMAVHVDEDEAYRVKTATDIPIVDREFMLQSEHEAWVISQVNNLEQDYGE